MAWTIGRNTTVCSNPEGLGVGTNSFYSNTPCPTCTTGQKPGRTGTCTFSLPTTCFFYPIHDALKQYTYHLRSPERHSAFAAEVWRPLPFFPFVHRPTGFRGWGSFRIDFHLDELATGTLLFDEGVVGVWGGASDGRVIIWKDELSGVIKTFLELFTNLRSHLSSSMTQTGCKSGERKETRKVCCPNWVPRRGWAVVLHAQQKLDVLWLWYPSTKPSASFATSLRLVSRAQYARSPHTKPSSVLFNQAIPINFAMLASLSTEKQLLLTTSSSSKTRSSLFPSYAVHVLPTLISVIRTLPTFHLAPLPLFYPLCFLPFIRWVCTPPILKPPLQPPRLSTHLLNSQFYPFVKRLHQFCFILFASVVPFALRVGQHVGPPSANKA